MASLKLLSTPKLTNLTIGNRVGQQGVLEIQQSTIRHPNRLTLGTALRTLIIGENCFGKSERFALIGKRNEINLIQMLPA